VRPSSCSVAPSSGRPDGGRSAASSLPPPAWLVDVEQPEVHARVRQLCQERTFDLILASQLPSAMYVRALEGVPKILDEVESGLFLDQVRMASDLIRRARRADDVVEVMRAS